MFSCENLRRACGLYGRAPNPEAARKFLSEHTQIFDLPVDCLVLHQTLQYTAHCSDNKKIVKHVLNFMKPRVKDDLKKQLIVALLECNLKDVKAILKNGVTLEIDWKNAKLPAIFYSTLCTKTDARKKMLMLLLEYGLNQKYGNHDGGNILHDLCYSADKSDDKAVEIAEILMNSGVSARPDNDGTSPLDISIDKQHIPLVAFFIKRGVDVNDNANDLYCTSLHRAVLQDNLEIVELVLSRGDAELDVDNHEGCTPLHYACSQHNEEIIDLLIREGAEMSPVDDKQQTPFQKLKPQEANYSECLGTMVKKFARLIFEDETVSESDMKLVKKNVNTQKFFEKCTSELKEMSNTKFYDDFYYYMVLEEELDTKKLSNLTRNKEFVKGFDKKISKFPNYKSDLRRILDDAVDIREESDAIVARLVFIFGKSLIEDVLKIVAENLTLEDLPLE